MPLLVLFIFGAVILGTGAMLSPAWPTSQPRVGLAATLALALIVGGAVFWALAFGWDTLVVDYMLFALVISIFLGGTLSYGQSRAEKDGTTLSDEEQGWTGPEDLALFAVLALILALPVLLLPAPPGQNGQTLGLMALAAREGVTFNSFAPFAPTELYLYPPGFSALSSYLSRQLAQPIPVIQFGVASVLMLACLWLIYDFGAEVRDKRFGRALLVALLCLPGFWTTYLHANFTGLLGLLFTLAFVTYAYRAWRYGLWWDVIGAGLLLGATIIVEPHGLPTALSGYLPWLVFLMLFRETRLPLMRWLPLAVAVPLIAVVATAPWLLNGLLPHRDLPQIVIDTGTTSALAFFGLFILAFPGALLPLLLRREPALTLAALWVLMPVPGAPATHYLIPLAILGGAALWWVWENLVIPRGRAVMALGLAALVVMGGSGLLLGVNLPPVTLTAADRAALDWLRENTARDAFVLNPPDSAWAGVVSERASAFMPGLPAHPAGALWSRPALTVTDLRAAGVDYVLAPADTPFNAPDTLTPVYDVDGARVYAVNPLAP